MQLKTYLEVSVTQQTLEDVVRPHHDRFAELDDELFAFLGHLDHPLRTAQAKTWGYNGKF